ncbi:MAG: hypothetical protein KI790_19500 [Cyclobacteriaceae bacterium]|nr:hypothetical protein [Cyclobacteriaceae bacterium HetDA_MAG_MS6]
MKISLSEIWNFIDLIGREEKGWSYQLLAGNVEISAIDHETLNALKTDPEYDTELLPSIFTFREILWQPDVFTEANMSLPGLRILKAYCEEYATNLEGSDSNVNQVYNQLILGLAANCSHAIEELEGGKVPVSRSLGTLRRYAFPIIKFFVYHPQNRVDYYRDAVNRLNYAVKIMLTQFHGRYTELEDPFWIVNYQQKKIPKESPVPSE